MFRINVTFIHCHPVSDGVFGMTIQLLRHYEIKDVKQAHAWMNLVIIGCLPGG